ncbi:type I DNA topoisomerase [Mesomycoplasma lagogenitalium]|uniref:DNA topoisomerase 1 n=1 Tax=Mesomycoplasma lagogenitalium TaxID=171286 RepID=A0ABY8LUR7_9BACT|nr:type I DNA topoisomerase [Mesomycoplasma lagogenitalium]WGI36982.1 type I DNA topoisomerase [Mesomycoplasma lagogenitalium]
MKKLVIVESPNKIESIKKYLGENYDVLASVGHIVELRTSGEYGFGIDLENWEPLYKEDPSKKRIIKELKDASKEADEIYIATDPDREGEAIGANLVDILKINDKYKRIKYNEITEEAIKNAISKPLKIDDNLVNAQKSRRMLDRIIGFRLSNLLNSKIVNSPVQPSAGRVQSVALKLVIDRETEIENFIPVQYFTIEALSKDKLIFNYFNKDKKFHNNSEWVSPEDIDKIMSELKGDLVVDDVKTTTKADPKIEPLKQSVLFKKSGLAASSVQSVLQKLYEGFGDQGLISYPRTDSTRLSETFIKQAQKYIKSKYGEKYLSTTIKGIAGDQDAHEAIRPTDCNLTPAMAEAKYNLSAIESKIYSIIYYTTLQAIMAVPIRKILRYECNNNNHKFKLTGSTIVFDGYHILTGYENEKELPVYQKGDLISIEKYNSYAKETQPPSRYNEGSLIEALDEIKVGRPSTFASTVNIIKDRFYVETINKALKPTEFGKIVLNKLLEATPKIINEKYTASTEEKLDLIADGKANYKQIMEDFWMNFQNSVNESAENLSKTALELEQVNEDCPFNNAPLVYRYNKKTGQRFIGCSSFPECRYMKEDPELKYFGNKKVYKPKQKSKENE